MTITPPLIPGDDHFNALANRLAATLSTAFGYSMPEAEEHIRNFYEAYEKAAPERRALLQKNGINETLEWSAADLFWHDDVALVLRIGYGLAGGDVNSVAFLDWRKTCWEALRNGQRVPAPGV